MTKICNKCKKQQPLENFPYKNKAEGIRQGWCRSCKSIHGRARYAKRKDIIIQQKKMYKRKCRAENEIKLYNYLIKHPCVDCGSSDPRAMQFDHVRDNKIFNIAERSFSYPWPTILKEIAKCETRCASCHQIKTASERGFWISPYYKRFGKNIIDEEQIDELMKDYNNLRKTDYQKLQNLAKDHGHTLRN